MSETRKIPYSQIGLEMGAIVFSVLLALLLNDWWSDRKTDAQHQKTITLIKTELQANRDDLVEAITYYRDIAPKIEEAMKDGFTDEEVAAIMDVCCDLMSGGTGRTSHEMAIITGLYASLEPETAALIIAPFVGQEDLQPVIQSFSDALVASDMSDPSGLLMRYYVFAMSITPSLEELKGITDEAIAVIEGM